MQDEKNGKHMEEALDEALRGTFPASDPVAIHVALPVMRVIKKKKIATKKRPVRKKQPRRRKKFTAHARKKKPKSKRRQR